MFYHDVEPENHIIESNIDIKEFYGKARQNKSLQHHLQVLNFAKLCYVYQLN